MADLTTVSILGATGSIGGSTADVILSQPGKFDVQAVTANTNADTLAAVARKLEAKQAVVADVSHYQALKEALAGTGIEVAAGPDAMLEAAAMPADWIMGAIVGMAGLLPLLKAIRQGTRVAIANKEPLVAAGPLVLETAARHGTKLLPVDSEHNAIFQVFDHERPEGIRRLILTASGGPFRTWSKAEMSAATPEQAVAHPNWSMGAKISVDSATMMNKALEIIEAHILFSMPTEKIDVLVHPQSVIHSMVEYIDGSVLAQLGAPDMRTPIANALAWPGRIATPGQTLDFSRMTSLEFEPPDPDRFPAIGLAYDCLAEGLHACIAFNAANEVAVEAFLARRIGFGDIAAVIKKALDDAETVALSGLDHILDYDRTVRTQTYAYIKQR